MKTLHFAQQWCWCPQMRRNYASMCFTQYWLILLCDKGQWHKLLYVSNISQVSWHAIAKFWTSASTTVLFFRDSDPESATVALSLLSGPLSQIQVILSFFPSRRKTFMKKLHVVVFLPVRMRRFREFQDHVFYCTCFAIKTWTWTLPTSGEQKCIHSTCNSLNFITFLVPQCCLQDAAARDRWSLEFHRIWTFSRLSRFKCINSRVLFWRVYTQSLRVFAIRIWTLSQTSATTYSLLSQTPWTLFFYSNRYEPCEAHLRLINITCPFSSEHVSLYLDHYSQNVSNLIS